MIGFSSPCYWIIHQSICSHYRLSSGFVLSRFKKASREEAGISTTDFAGLSLKNRKVLRRIGQTAPSKEERTSSSCENGVGLPPQNFRYVRIAGRRVLVFMTTRAEEADEWVRRVEETWPGTRIVGLSFFWEPSLLPDGSLRRRVSSIHLSYLTHVLVYRLSSAENDAIAPNDPIAPRLVNFLCDFHNMFFGEDLNRNLEAIGLYGSLGPSLMTELLDVAQICRVPRIVILATRLPLHVVLAAVLLRDMDIGLLLLEDIAHLTPCSWPMTEIQVQFAAETSFVGQRLGNSAYASLFP
ncbi:unnamed protein product [Spirodela intermedia]|uniref:Uncharacterized protein n=1 Tax=Spirodela intermedia TaxID=51605 RepID=A0A7I8IZS4_SPIIN|nr:unnamed protein product [Spirodela intermedia]CAA6663466.1 unnamed protein product [Spirodela intermedia]